MADLGGIENLPEDVKRHIVTRVAEEPGGARTVARVFAVSKSFQQFSEDRDVLKAVSFSEMFLGYRLRYPMAPNLLRLFEQLQEVGGLVARSAIAGNTDAQFLLAKVVMISASTMLKANAVANRPIAKYLYFLDLARTSNFITNFSDRRGYFDLVKLFLSRAEVDEVEQMMQYLVDFMAYFIEPGKGTDYQQFRTSLRKFCGESSFIAPAPSNSIASMVEQFNHMCTKGDSTMREMGCSEEMRRPLLQSVVEMNDTVEYETLIERLDRVQPVLEVVSQMSSFQDDRELDSTTITLFVTSLILRYDLVLGASISKARIELMSKFLALTDN